jgi:hypothetical protein
MRIFFVGKGRTRVCGETYLLYAAARNPRRTPPNGKKTIYGWKLISGGIAICSYAPIRFNKNNRSFGRR